MASPQAADDAPAVRAAPPRTPDVDTPWWAPLVATAVFFGVMWAIPALLV